MAFKLYKHDIADSTSMVNDYKMTNSEAVAVGEALTTASTGVLSKCAATTMPDFISNSVIAATNPSTIPVQVIRTNEQQEWEVIAPVTIATSLIGSKVTLSSDGLSITATTSSGVFFITYTDAVTGGGIVRGMFRR